MLLNSRQLPERKGTLYGIAAQVFGWKKLHFQQQSEGDRYDATVSFPAIDRG